MSLLPRLLLIEDDPGYAERLRRNLESEGFAVDVSTSGEEAIERSGDAYYDLIITDIRLPGMNGIDIIQRVRAGEASIDADAPIVVVSSVDDVSTVVEAMRLGAADYITKESRKTEIVVRLRKVLEQSRLLNENRMLRDQLARNSDFDEMIGVSAPMRKIKEELAELAGGAVPVLLTGETGVGKELVARALHRTGPSADGPFVEVNCAALPDENFFQSEVFGHERGAFTGATQQKKGRFELAEGGTLFLDEIGELPMESQAKLLTAIETLTFTRLGGTRQISTSCRLLFATNRDLEKDVKEGRFREDLYYRVNVYPIRVPPLRERADDIAPLIRHYLDAYADKYGRPRRQLGDDTLALLRGYHWPGNIRELKNVAERLIIRAREEIIGADQVHACGIGQPATQLLNVHIPDEGLDLETVNRNLVIAALEKTEWNQKQAAELLGISADRMNARVKKYDLRNPKWRVNR